MIDLDDVFEIETWQPSLTATKTLFSLPELNENEVFSCMRCSEDVRRPKFHKHVYQTIIDNKTRLKTEKFDQFFVPRCCHSDLEIYNTVSDKPRSIPKHHFNNIQTYEAKYLAQAAQAERWVS